MDSRKAMTDAILLSNMCPLRPNQSHTYCVRVRTPRVDALGAAGSQGTTSAGDPSGVACLRSEGLLLMALVGAGEEAKAERPLYRLYGMYLAVLSTRRAAEEAAQLNGDTASTVFGPARGRGSESRRGDGWEQLADGTLRSAPARDPVALPQGPLAGWPWARGFAMALVPWASAHQWIPGSSHITYAEPPVDFEFHNN